MANQENISRKEFLEKMKIIAASSAFAGALSWINVLKAEGTGTKVANGKIRVGVIGVGGRGRKLLLHLLRIPDFEVVAVCDDYDPNYERALKITEGKAKGFKDYRKMLEMKDLDAVVIAAPLYWHKPMTVDAFEAGKHVFCEKAMAMNVEDCLAMVQSRKDSGKILQIGHQRMFDIVYLEAMEQIKANKLGHIGQIRGYWHRNNNWRRDVPNPSLERKINWRLYWDYSRGLITELGTHHFQVAHWVMGEMPIQVSGSGSINYWKDGREVYDNINLIFKYANGTHFIYDSMISNKKYGAEMQIMGDEGTMELESGLVYSEAAPPADPGILQLITDIERRIFNVIPVGGASWLMDKEANNGAYIVDKMNIPESTHLQFEAFAQCIKENKHLEDLERESLNASLMAMYGHEAMVKNEVITIPNHSIL